MPESAITRLKEHLADLPDPRAQHSIEHLLIDIIVLITICAVICGAEVGLRSRTMALLSNNGGCVAKTSQW